MFEYPHTSKPDLDNLVKSVKDALTGIAWRDDSQVCAMTLSKVVTRGDGPTGVYITIREV